MSASKSAGPTQPQPPPGLDDLRELAMDLRWSWDHGADDLWRRLDPKLWELTHHPNVVLQTVSREKLAGTLADPDYRRHGFNKSIPRLRSPASPIFAWSSC